MVLSSSLSMCSLFNGKIFSAADQASNLGNSHVTCHRLGALHSAFSFKTCKTDFQTGSWRRREVRERRKHRRSPVVQHDVPRQRFRPSQAIQGSVP